MGSKFRNLQVRVDQLADTRRSYQPPLGLHQLGKGIGLLLLTFFLTFAVPAFGANTQSQEQQDVVRATLKNGLRVVIVPNTLAPVITTMINYLVGSNEAPEGFPGMAHAQEHMMFRGSPGLSADQLANIMAAMGGRFDADTQQTVTQYFFTVPAEDLDVALHIGSIRMRGVLDEQKLWEQERGAIEQEVARDLSNPQYLFYTKLLEKMFKGTPYAHSPLGTVASFNKTTGAALKDFHDQWYAPNNAILVIVGDVQPQQVLDKVKKFFEDIPSKKLPERPKIELEPVKPETLQMTTDLPFGLVSVAFRMPGYDSPDYAAAQVLSDALNNQRGNLYALVPAGKALLTEFSIDNFPQTGLGYAIAAFPKGSDTEALINEVRQILAEYKKTGIPEDLVEAAKRSELTDAELEKNSITGLAMTWSQVLAVEGRESPAENEKAIQKVTAADVKRVANKYLDLDHAIVAVLTPQVSGKPISTKGFKGRESFAPEHAKPVQLPDWATQALENVRIPPSAIKAQVTVLPNGLKLIVQRESVSNTVSVYGYIEHQSDLETPKGQEGVDQVLEQLFSYGTTSLDRIEFQKALDDIGAQESAGTDFSLQVLSSHFDRGVELMADNELSPALPEEGFKIVQQQVAGTVAGLLESPDFLTKQALKVGLYPKHDPTLRHPTPASVSSLKLKDVKDYYKKVFRPDLTTIVVIGDVTPEKAKTVIEKHFGAWKASGPKPDVLLAPVPLNEPSSTVVPNASRVQDKVVLAETLGLTRSNPEYYALELGNHVLGGAFYATRFYKDLRQERGLVYYVVTEFDVRRTRAHYIVEYGCDPINVSKARSIIVRDLEQMTAEPVSEDELKQARRLLIRQIPLSESSISDIAQGMISRTVLDLPLDEPTVAAHHYMKLNADQVKAAFARYIRPKDLVQVVEGPSPQ